MTVMKMNILKVYKYFDLFLIFLKYSKLIVSLAEIIISITLSRAIRI